jgi:hypothetical protein
MAGPSKLYVKQIQIKAAAHTSFLKMCSDVTVLNVCISIINGKNKERLECIWQHKGE